MVVRRAEGVQHRRVSRNETRKREGVVGGKKGAEGCDVSGNSIPCWCTKASVWREADNEGGAAAGPCLCRDLSAWMEKRGSAMGGRSKAEVRITN